MGYGQMGAVGILKLAIADADGAKPEKVKARILAADQELAIITRTSDEIVVPPGLYRVIVSAPGYRNASVDFNIKGNEAKPLSITLSKTTFAEDVWTGFRTILLPQRERAWPIP